MYLKLGFVFGPDAFSRITHSLWLEFFVGFDFVGFFGGLFVIFFRFLELAVRSIFFI